jgi:hypothetical protein
MKTTRNYIAILMAAAALGLGACQQGGQSIVQHKLVATGNDHSVPMYPDEQTYMKVSHMEQQGGVEGMAGDVRKSLSAKAIDDQTVVSIVSSDENGALVEVAEGPMKGQSGFVARQNLE